MVAEHRARTVPLNETKQGPVRFLQLLTYIPYLTVEKTFSTSNAPGGLIMNIFGDSTVHGLEVHGLDATQLGLFEFHIDLIKFLHALTL